MLLTAKDPPQFLYPDIDLPSRIIVPENEQIRLACAAESHYSICKAGNLEIVPGTFLCPAKAPAAKKMTTTKGMILLYK